MRPSCERLVFKSRLAAASWPHRRPNLSSNSRSSCSRCRAMRSSVACPLDDFWTEAWDLVFSTCSTKVSRRSSSLA